MTANPRECREHGRCKSLWWSDHDSSRLGGNTRLSSNDIEIGGTSPGGILVRRLQPLVKSAPTSFARKCASSRKPGREWPTTSRMAVYRRRPVVEDWSRRPENAGQIH